MNHPVYAADSVSQTRRVFLATLGGLAIPALAFGQQVSSEVNLIAFGDWGAPFAKGGSKDKDPERKQKLQNLVAAAMTDYAAKSVAAGSKIDAVLPLEPVTHIA